MKWLLIFVWMSSTGLEITTERFATKAECETVGRILLDWSHFDAPHGQMRWWKCHELTGG